MKEECWFCEGKADWGLPPGTLVPTCNAHLGISRGDSMGGKFVQQENGEVWWVPKSEGGLDARYYAKTRHPASQKFHDFCDRMKSLHDQKQQDYGRENDPFANVRSTEEWGQPAWVGAMIRATDKMRRLQKVAQGGTLSNEGAEDSFMDLAVYTIIGLVLYQEQQPHVPSTDEMKDILR